MQKSKFNFIILMYLIKPSETRFLKKFVIIYLLFCIQ